MIKPCWCALDQLMIIRSQLILPTFIVNQRERIVDGVIDTTMHSYVWILDSQFIVRRRKSWKLRTY